ncbi:hypothetical protein BDN72DRAFT_864345 [Pluteus cervinus]|uniref:Uncharacterized protein n=1 Tax=Pluteus cervinus TaxID=181527 RepID=A0ACD3A446_9AGAR|nr:hypothetical protein BDN72DRAFT_864345 [Pluteus cervinus]
MAEAFVLSAQAEHERVIPAYPVLNIILNEEGRVETKVGQKQQAQLTEMAGVPGGPLIIHDNNLNRQNPHSFETTQLTGEWLCSRMNLEREPMDKEIVVLPASNKRPPIQAQRNWSASVRLTNTKSRGRQGDETSVEAVSIYAIRYELQVSENELTVVFLISIPYQHNLQRQVERHALIHVHSHILTDRPPNQHTTRLHVFKPSTWDSQWSQNNNTTSATGRQPLQNTRKSQDYQRKPLLLPGIIILVVAICTSSRNTGPLNRHLHRWSPLQTEKLCQGPLHLQTHHRYLNYSQTKRDVHWGGRMSTPSWCRRLCIWRRDESYDEDVTDNSCSETRKWALGKPTRIVAGVMGMMGRECLGGCLDGAERRIVGEEMEGLRVKGGVEWIDLNRRTFCQNLVDW